MTMSFDLCKRSLLPFGKKSPILSLAVSHIVIKGLLNKFQTQDIELIGLSQSRFSSQEKYCFVGVSIGVGSDSKIDLGASKSDLATNVLSWPELPQRTLSLRLIQYQINYELLFAHSPDNTH